MHYCAILIILGSFELCYAFWPAGYRVDFRDDKIFVITAGEDVGDDDDDDENENEMIQPDDLVNVISLAEDEPRYKPLHSHVEHYNRRAAHAALQTESSPLQLMKEIHSFDEEKPYIAGFKHELDKYNFKETVENLTSQKEVTEIFSPYTENVDQEIKKIFGEKEFEAARKIISGNRTKREEEDKISDLTEAPEGDLLETMSPRNTSLPEQPDGYATPNPVSPPKSDLEPENPGDYGEENTKIFLEHSTLIKNNEEETTESGNRRLDTEGMTNAPDVKEIEEEAYDYDNFKAEYDRQLEEAKNNNLTFNYTDNGEPEETAKDAIKKIVKFDMPKNCTKEELTQFGVKALECLAFDYQQARNESDARKILARTWTVVRVWVCIYVCIAVPCWFQKGWCCCCFRCSMCFPDDVISAAKHYYAQNPPGVLVDQPKGTNKEESEESSPINYKPTLFELDAYEDFESAIRNL